MSQFSIRLLSNDKVTLGFDYTRSEAKIKEKPVLLHEITFGILFLSVGFSWTSK